MNNWFVVGVGKEEKFPEKVITDLGKANVSMAIGKPGDQVWQYGWLDGDEQAYTATITWTPEVALIPKGKYTADELIHRIRTSEKIAKERLQADQVFFFVHTHRLKDDKSEA
jgi:hypothetical protein